MLGYREGAISHDKSSEGVTGTSQLVEQQSHKLKDEPNKTNEAGMCEANLSPAYD